MAQGLAHCLSFQGSQSSESGTKINLLQLQLRGIQSRSLASMGTCTHEAYKHMTHTETTTHCGGCSVPSATSFLQPFFPSSLEGDTRGTEEEVDCIEGRRKEGAELLGGLKTNLKRNHKIRDVCLWRLMRPEAKYSIPISDAPWERWRRRARGVGVGVGVLTPQ